MKPTYSRIAISNIVNSLERAKSTRSIEDIFLEELEHSIVTSDIKNSHKPSATYKPSGMNCMRSCFYALMNMPATDEQKTASSCGICESGTDRHIRIQQALESMKDNGFELEYVDVESYINTHNLQDKLQVVAKSGMETKIYAPDYNMSFLTDGIIKYKNIYYIFEFKTEVASKFYKRTDVDTAHITQGTAYSAMFNIPQVLFLYENRDSCTHKAFILNVTEEMKNDRIYNFISECNNYVNECKVPPMPSDKDILKKCKYCSYQALCASHGLGSNTIIEKAKLNENEDNIKSEIDEKVTISENTKLF